MAETAGSITVNVPQAGECTIRLDLYNPTNCIVTVEAGGTELPGEEEPGEETPSVFPETLDVVSYSTGEEVLLVTLQPVAGEEGVYTGTYSGEVRDQINIVDRTNSVWYGCDSNNNALLSSADSKWNIWFDGTGAVTITVDLNNMNWNYTNN